MSPPQSVSSLLSRLFWRSRPCWLRSMSASRSCSGSSARDGTVVPLSCLSSAPCVRPMTPRAIEFPTNYALRVLAVFCGEAGSMSFPSCTTFLVGEMSFVGPRPLLPIDQPKWQTSRLFVRPGLTGWAQVNGGRDISPEDKAALDIWYIMNASLWLDIRILLRTLCLVIFGDGQMTRLSQGHTGVEGARKRATAESAPMLTDVRLLTTRGAPGTR